MNPTRPSEVRRNLDIAHEKITRLKGVLQENTRETRWGLGTECEHVARKLGLLLSEHRVPEVYRIAVIGRFKVGKSAFVNELLGRRLAGEDTSPETAAVTTFRAGSVVRAKINFIERSVWKSLIYTRRIR
jgi:ribosome biogenesis GTPase A